MDDPRFYHVKYLAELALIAEPTHPSKMHILTGHNVGVRGDQRCNGWGPRAAYRQAALRGARARHHGKHFRWYPASAQGHQRAHTKHLHPEGMIVGIYIVRYTGVLRLQCCGSVTV